MYPDIIVELATALICFGSACHPALVGPDTPKGEYEIRHYRTETPGYGGDLLVFKMENNEAYAIHRVLDLPGQQRLARLNSPYPSHRITVTAGCVNVSPEVYESLLECCTSSKLIIR